MKLKFTAPRRFISRHISVPAVTNGDSIQPFLMPETGILESILWVVAMAKTTNGDKRGYAVLSQQQDTAQLFGAPFQGVTQGAISAVVIGDLSTATLSQLFWVHENLYDRLDLPVQAREPYAIILNSSAAGCTMYCEAFLRFRV
jgi:hypothetical protein